MAYEQPKNLHELSKPEKQELLKEYVEHYRQLIEKGEPVPNQKIPRELFKDLLDQLGNTLLTESARLAREAGPVQKFLKDNPLPSQLKGKLPAHFRVFCLALNSVKQWVAKEQLLTDHYLLGGNARELCREAAETCLVNGSVLGKGSELHHPVRDGRPPILLSKEGHASIERKAAVLDNTPMGKALCELRREWHGSWVQLRRGCLDLLGEPVQWPSKPNTAGAHSFAKKAKYDKGYEYKDILKWLEEKHLG